MLSGDDQDALCEQAQRFAREVLLPDYQARDASGGGPPRVDRALLRRLGELGLIGVDLAERHGGLAAGAQTAGLVVEAVARADLNLVQLLVAASVAGGLIERHADAATGAHWLPRIAAGQALVAPGSSGLGSALDLQRVLLALSCTAAAAASLAETWVHAQQRQAMGVPIVQYQGVSFPLAEAEAHLAGARALALRSLALHDAGRPCSREAAMGAWLGPRVAFDALHHCILSVGHAAWSLDLPHQQRLRDVLSLSGGDPAVPLQRILAGRRLDPASGAGVAVRGSAP